MRSIEYQLSYQVGENNRLTFVRSLAKAKESGVRMQDFGVWVYLETYGFYSKAAGSFNYLLRPGISLSAEQVPLFIRMNREELHVIPKFFSEHCPVNKAGLKIELTDKKKVRITPEYELITPYQGKTIVLFDDFVYLEGEGFHELPLDLRLPEKFRHPIEMEGEELQLFLTYELESIAKYASFIDPRLKAFKNGALLLILLKQPRKKEGAGTVFPYLMKRNGGLFQFLFCASRRGRSFPLSFLKMGLSHAQQAV